MAFCKNCGNEVSDGAKFCGACGTARRTAAGVPVGVYNNTLDDDELDDDDLEDGGSDNISAVMRFILRTFEDLINVILVLILIGCTFCGGGLFFWLSKNNAGYAVLGAFLGFIFGMFLCLCWFGVLATYIKMGKDISAIRKKVNKISNGAK